MNRLIIILILGVLLTNGCKKRREVDALSSDEMARIDDLVIERDECFVREVTNLDDGYSPVDEIIRAVLLRCQGFEQEVRRILDDEYMVRLGAAWKYSSDLEKTADVRIREAIIARRQILRPEDPETLLLKRKP